MRLFMFLMLVCLLCVSVFAQDIVYQDEIILLALRESGDDKSGTVAKLRLQVIPGEERVFLETYPMTKVSTQASLRFAQQVACKELDFDCSNYDFLFSIESLPGIIGGPSAGSAATLLVAGALLDKPIPKDIAITGTINSGGTVGPVGGLKYKVEAAGNNGIKTVLLPRGTGEFKEDNVTTDLIALGNELNLTVKEVTSINEAISDVFNYSFVVSDAPLVVSDSYAETMKSVAEKLCARTESFAKTGLNSSEVINFTNRAKSSFESGAYYSAASYCFRANLGYVNAEYESLNLSKDDLAKRILAIKKEADVLLNETNSREINSLTDVQTYMAVRERIDETVDLLRNAAANINGNESIASDVAYAQERLFSARVWSNFFNGEDKMAIINEDRLRTACTSKIAEAEERFNYVVSVIPDALKATREDIDAAHVRLSKKEYIMCLYTAAKAKSTGNVLLNLMGVEESRFDEVIETKLAIVKNDLLKAQDKGVFPIIAYSYYEYASSLKEFDRVSALLFTEYALELANFDIYFEDKVEKKSILPKRPSWLFGFFAGLSVGALFVLISLQLYWNSFRKNKEKVSKSRRAVSSSRFKTQSGSRRRPKGKKR